MSLDGAAPNSLKYKCIGLYHDSGLSENESGIKFERTILLCARLY
jgi:hypothetical protein